MIFVVSYDLSKTLLRPLAPFFEELQRSDVGREWWHFLTNTWLIQTPETPQQLFERLQPHLNQSDRLLIMRVEPDYSGSLPRDAWQWIQEHASGGQFSQPLSGAGVR